MKHWTDWSDLATRSDGDNGNHILHSWTSPQKGHGDVKIMPEACWELEIQDQSIGTAIYSKAWAMGKDGEVEQ